ncbi:hypothetical protein VNI00_004728 [Paramarasmius palmivorus]|uniref:Uncharacterized protein n=1 Tax=Paramarasmius palmivorus TaxID=297713 RepID=A0AAW0DJI4_9AGAR
MSDGLTFAQRLYASALPASRQPTVRAQSRSSTECDIDTNVQSVSDGSNITAPSPRNPAVATNIHSASQPPTLVPLASSLNSEAYSSTVSTTRQQNGQSALSLGPSESPQSFYATRIAGQTQSLRAQTSGLAQINNSAHPAPHRTQSYPVTQATTPSEVTRVTHHCAATYSSGTAVDFTKPYEFTPPREVPHRVLVAKPPQLASSQTSSQGSSQQYGNPSSANVASSWYSTNSGVATTNVPPPPPPKPSIQSQNTLPTQAHRISASGPTSSLLPHNTPLQQQYQSPATFMQPASPPMSANIGAPSPNARPTSIFSSITQRPGSLLSSAAGGAALGLVGGAVLGGVLGLSPDLSGLAGSFLSGDTLGSLTSSLANFNPSDAGVDLGQFQSALQGAPGTDYQSIYNSIIQQQQTSPTPGVDYQLIVDTLHKIQQLSSPGGTSPYGSTSLNSGSGATNPYQAIANAHTQQMQGLMNTIQQQSALNAQTMQQQIQQIQNASQAQANSQMQHLLHGMQLGQPHATQPAVVNQSGSVQPPHPMSHHSSPPTSPNHYAQQSPQSPNQNSHGANVQFHQAPRPTNHSQSPPTSPHHSGFHQQPSQHTSPNPNVQQSSQSHYPSGVNPNAQPQPPRPTQLPPHSQSPPSSPHYPGLHQQHSQHVSSNPSVHSHSGVNYQSYQPTRPTHIVPQTQQVSQAPNQVHSGYAQQQQPPRPTAQQVQPPLRPPVQQQSYNENPVYNHNTQQQPYDDATSQNYSYQPDAFTDQYNNAPDSGAVDDDAPPPFSDTIDVLGQALVGIANLSLGTGDGEDTLSPPAGDIPQYILTDDGGGLDYFANGILTAASVALSQ